MRKEVKKLLGKADRISAKVTKNLFAVYEFILSLEGLAPLK